MAAHFPQVGQVEADDNDADVSFDANMMGDCVLQVGDANNAGGGAGNSSNINMMGDGSPRGRQVAGNDTDSDDSVPSMWNVSNISVNDSPEEEPVHVNRKRGRPPFTGRSYAGEELQKMLGNDLDLNTQSAQDVPKTEKPRQSGRPVAPILKYYEIIGPPWSSADRHNIRDQQLPEEDRQPQLDESARPLSRKRYQSSKNIHIGQSGRILPLETLPELDQIPPEEDLYRSPFTSTPIMDKSNTLPLSVGIRLLGMSME